jgi:hypothetical protein
MSETVTETPTTDWGKVWFWAIVVLAGLVAIVAVASWLLFPGTSTDTEGLARLGIWLLVLGVGLMVAALFVGLLDVIIKAFTRTIKVTTKTTGADAVPSTLAVPADLFKSVLGVAGDLVKVPAGIGALIGILGVSLLIGMLLFGTPARTVETKTTERSSADQYPLTEKVVTETTVTNSAE